MATQASPYETIGIYTLPELAKRFGIPEASIRTWAAAGHMHVIRDPFGTFRSSLAEVHRAASTVKARGVPRSWELSPEMVAEIEAERALAEQEMALA